MKQIFFISFSMILIGSVNGQEHLKDTSKNNESIDLSISKTDLVGTWRACGESDWDENADTLIFQHSTPNCRGNDCGQHNWIFRETGSVEFVYTDGCDTGFHSVSKDPKKWLFVKKNQQIKMVTNWGYIEYFDVLKLDEKLVLLHRKDLELD